MLQINSENLNEKIAKRWEEIGLFYPLKQAFLEIRESEVKKEKGDLLFVKLENIPPNVWVFENEYAQQEGQKDASKRCNSSKKETRFRAFQSSGKKVEKILIWENENQLHLLLIELKSGLTYKNASECMSKVDSSLDTFSPFLASHPHFGNLSKNISPFALFCFNRNDCIYEDSGYLEERTTRFKKKYIDNKEHEFKINIEPYTLTPLFVPVALRINTTENLDGFSLNFQDIFPKLASL